MAKVFGRNAGVFTTNPASGDEKRLCEVDLAFRSFNFKEFVDLTNLCHSTAGLPRNAIFLGGTVTRVTELKKNFLTFTLKPPCLAITEVVPRQK